MFSIRRWISHWRRPIAVSFDDLDTTELADRVHNRLHEIRDEENPFRGLLKITSEEIYEQRLMQQLRDTMALREIVHALPPRQRSVLFDHVERGLNYKQIARERGMTERIVLRDLVRAYATIRLRVRSSDERANDDGNDGTGETGSTLSGVWPAEAHVGKPDRVCDDGPTIEHFLDGSGNERPAAGSQEG